MGVMGAQPGTRSEEKRARYRPEGGDGGEKIAELALRKSSTRGVHISKQDIRADKYEITPGCEECIAANREITSAAQ